MRKDPDRRADTPQGHEAYSRILEEIRTGQLRPKARLTETELAARLSISRTPVREALRMLEADGLVEHVPRVGAAVRSLDYAEVMELYEMRVVLEGTAARLAARAASDLELAELDSINSEMADTADELRVAELNRVFHLALLNAAKNRFLIRAMSTLQKTLLILGPSTLGDEGRQAEALDEHRRVMAALRTRDGSVAERAMRVHIEAAQRTRLRLIRAHIADAL